mgnify:CR=1 FL=1
MMASPLKRSDLMSLEQYSQKRSDFRNKVIAHKKNRRVGIGPHLFLYFEDRLTVQYQVQEMLRIEKIFESAGIEEELEAYNPLIPDGRNFKATMLLEYPDAQDRKQKLAGLIGIEDNKPEAIAALRLKAGRRVPVWRCGWSARS